ncbi:MAG: hypothetical protein MZV63_54360 [Marinilabiliales bacterium]|nr:hypothetical protein [Marinilabiliales bacterium]
MKPVLYVCNVDESICRQRQQLCRGSQGVSRTPGARVPLVIAGALEAEIANSL